MNKGPRFWAIVVAIWVGMVLSVVNIAEKVDLFMSMSANQ